MSQARTIPGAIEAAVERFDPAPAPHGCAPVFLFASAWRSGSTLVQRLLVSRGELLMWGEPYDHAGLIRRMAESLLPFDEKWPPANYIVTSDKPPSAERWIANAYPHPTDLFDAHRAFFDRLFERPAYEAGFPRWGVKGVRLGGEHAVYLRHLYPDARFIFLHRNPYDAFLSYRALHEIRPNSYWWYHRWPDEPVSSAAQFGSLWRRLTRSFLSWAPRVEALVVAYEDIVRGQRLDALAAAAAVSIDASILTKRVGATSDEKGSRENVRPMLTSLELDQLRDNVDDLANELGYVGPTPPEP